LNKVKWILRLITICCTLIPLLVVGYIYRDNFPIGLIVPPQLKNLINQNGLGNSSVLIPTLAQLGINPNIQMPQFENLTYDSSRGIATVTLNLTNPLTHQSLDVSNFSLTIAYSIQNTQFNFTIQLVGPIHIVANQTGDISIQLKSSNPQALQSLLSGNQAISNLQMSNLYVNVNGITVQISNLNGLYQSNYGNNGS
jgi:hypothetical protein